MFTAYALTSVINSLLEQAGAETVSSQQVYNATQRLRDRVGNSIPRDDAAEFVKAYVQRRLTGSSARRTPEQLRAELGL